MSLEVKPQEKVGPKRGAHAKMRNDKRRGTPRIREGEMSVSVEDRIPGESGLGAEEECENMLIKGAHSGIEMEVPGCAPASKPPRLTDTAAPPHGARAECRPC